MFKKNLTAIGLMVLFIMYIVAGVLFQNSKNISDKAKETSSNPSSETVVSNDDLTPVVLNEVVHSVFYAPMYVALNNGYFEENGLDVELITGNGADKSMTSLITGESQIILAGAESSMYIQANENNPDGKDVVNFMQLTKRAGNFLVAKDGTENFTWADVKGKTIIGGRVGGMPQITLEYVLKENGIDPVNDVTIITNLDFTATVGAFATGEYDYTVEFEPNATKLEKEGYGTVVASLGVDGGEIPYTSFITTREFAEGNEEVLVSFIKAMNQALEYIEQNDSKTIAKAVNPYFESISLEDMTSIVDRYKQQDTWNKALACDVESYNKLIGMLKDAGTLQNDVDLEKLIDNSYVDKAKGE